MEAQRGVDLIWEKSGRRIQHPINIQYILYLWAQHIMGEFAADAEKATLAL